MSIFFNFLLLFCSLGLTRAVLTDNVNMHEEERLENLKAKDHAFGKKAQRGKGSYGGANVVHRRPNAKSAASVLESPFGCISTNVCISFSLLLALAHLIA